MSNRAGQRGTVVRGESDSLHYRLMIDEVESTLTAAEVAILDTNGNEIVARTSSGVSFSGAVATYTRTWGASLFEIEDGFRAVFYLTSGGLEYTRRLYFDVVIRAFHSQLADQDITDVNPYIQNLSGQTSLATFRREAWRQISDTLRQRLRDRGRRTCNPGNVFYPEQFFEAHRLLTMSRFYFATSFSSAGSEDWDKYETLREQAFALIDQQLSKVDVDLWPQDGRLEPQERGLNFAGVSLVR